MKIEIPDKLLSEQRTVAKTAALRAQGGYSPTWTHTGPAGTSLQLVQPPSAAQARESPIQHISSGESSRGSHQLMAAAGCPRAYALSYLTRQRIKREPANRLAGTLIHTALAHYYAHKLKERGEPTPPWYVQGNLRNVLTKESGGRPELVQQAIEVLNFYGSVYASESLQAVSVEEEYTATLGELCAQAAALDPKFTPLTPADLPDGMQTPAELADLLSATVSCRVDLIARANGKLVILDHKCTDSGARGRLYSWARRNFYRASLQVMLNLLITQVAFKKRGLEGPERFVVQRIKRSPPFDIDRNTVEVAEQTLSAAANTAVQYLAAARAIERQLARVKEPLKLYPSLAHCHTRYGACDYFDVCHASGYAAQAESAAASLYAAQK